jgi:hypothetical protein
MLSSDALNRAPIAAVRARNRSGLRSLIFTVESESIALIYCLLASLRTRVARRKDKTDVSDQVVEKTIFNCSPLFKSHWKHGDGQIHNWRPLS